MGNVLFRDDYRKAVETCEFQRSGFGLKSFVDDFLKAYQDHNFDMISELMEYVLDVFPEVEDQPDMWNFQEIDIVNFKEEAAGILRPQLQYLYSYLIYISENEAGTHQAKQIVVVPAKSSSEPIIKPSTQLSFKATISSDSLKELLRLLVNNEYIEPISFENFSKIFNAIPINQLPQKIIWTKFYQKEKGFVDNKPLFLMLSTICDEADSFHNSGFVKRIISCFALSGGKEFKYPALLKSKKEFDPKELKMDSVVFMSKVVKSLI